MKSIHNFNNGFFLIIFHHIITIMGFFKKIITTEYLHCIKKIWKRKKPTGSQCKISKLPQSTRDKSKNYLFSYCIWGLSGTEMDQNEWILPLFYSISGKHCFEMSWDERLMPLIIWSQGLIAPRCPYIKEFCLFYSISCIHCPEMP